MDTIFDGMDFLHVGVKGLIDIFVLVRAPVRLSSMNIQFCRMIGVIL